MGSTPTNHIGSHHTLTITITIIINTTINIMAGSLHSKAIMRVGIPPILLVNTTTHMVSTHRNTKARIQRVNNTMAHPHSHSNHGLVIFERV